MRSRHTEASQAAIWSRRSISQILPRRLNRSLSFANGTAASRRTVHKGKNEREEERRRMGGYVCAQAMVTNGRSAPGLPLVQYPAAPRDMDPRPPERASDRDWLLTLPVHGTISLNLRFSKDSPNQLDAAIANESLHGGLLLRAKRTQGQSTSTNTARCSHHPCARVTQD